MTQTQHTAIQSFIAAPAFVVRIAGMPMDVLSRLRFDRTMEMVDSILVIENWLRQMSEPLSDGLYEVIGGLEDRDLRRRLISLRRDAYVGRLPKDGRPDDQLLSTIPQDLAAQIEEWFAQVVRRSDLEATLEEVLAAELVEKRRALRDAVTDNAFQNGVVLASSDLYPDLARWIGVEGEPEEDRKLELRLAKYLSRVAAKTSPYSTFTGSAEGHWSPGSGPAVQWSGNFSRRSVVELNAYTVQQIQRSISRWPEIRPHLMLRVNSSLVETGEVLRFLGRKKGEAVVELASTATLRRFLDEVRGGNDRSYGEVVAALSGASSHDQRDKIARFLDQLIDIGLVEIGFGIADNALDPLGDLVSALEPFEGPKIETVRNNLSKLREDLESYARLSEPPARFERARAIRSELEAIYRSLDWDPTGELFPKNSFYEDTLLDATDLSCSTDSWSEVLEDLHLLQQVAGLYDRFLPTRLATGAFFVDHYREGASVPLLEFYRDFYQEIREPPGWRKGYRVSGKDLLRCFEEPFPVPRVGLASLDEVADLQQRLVEHVADLPADAKTTRRINPASLREFTSTFPEYVEPIESMAFYCQAFERDGETHAVLNEVTSGFGRSRARSLRLDRVGGGGGFDYVGAPDGPYAEIAGATDSNLNLKLAMTPYEIAYPGNVSGRPEEERLPLNDLLVVHDVESDILRLVSKRLGTAITPVHLGTMVEFLLPPAYRFLIQVFGQAVPRFEFIKELATASPCEESEGVRRYPRLCLGSVVINRSSWTALSNDVPQHDKGQSTLDYMLAVHRWRCSHDIPMRCFVRAFSGDRAAGRRIGLAGLLDKARKPLYIDFASPFFLRVFEQIAREPGRLLVIEEMLPTEDDLILRDSDGEHGYASEFVFELTDHEERHAASGMGQRPHLLSR